MQIQTQISSPPRPPFPPRRIATGSPEPEPRRPRTNVLYAVGMEPSAELAGPRPLPTVPPAPPAKAPGDITEGIAALENPWGRRLVWGIGLGLGARFVVSPIAAQFLNSEQEAAIAGLPLGAMLTGYQPTPEQRRRQVLASYI